MKQSQTRNSEKLAFGRRKDFCSYRVNCFYFLKWRWTANDKRYVQMGKMLCGFFRFYKHTNGLLTLSTKGRGAGVGCGGLIQTFRTWLQMAMTEQNSWTQHPPHGIQCTRLTVRQMSVRVCVCVEERRFVPTPALERRQYLSKGQDVFNAQWINKKRLLSKPSCFRVCRVSAVGWLVGVALEAILDFTSIQRY